jgi:hypothetical protein
MRIHGKITAPNTSPKGAVPQRVLITEAKTISMHNMDTRKNKISTTTPLIPVTTFKTKTMIAIQKKVAKHKVIDVSFAILSFKDKKKDCIICNVSFDRTWYPKFVHAKLERVQTSEARL